MYKYRLEAYVTNMTAAKRRQAQLAATKAKLSNRPFRFLLGAVLSSDNRPGKMWA